MSREVKVTFQPSGRSVYVLPGTILLEAAARGGHIIQTPCGGAGKCGKCLVRITAGECPSCPECARVLGEEKVRAGWRLACQCKVQGPLTVEIPDSSLFQTGQKILSHGSGEDMHVQPAVARRYVELEQPGRDVMHSDSELLKAALGPVEIELAALRALPQALREGGFKVTATLVRDRVVDLHPGNRADACFGVAFDIGTTTLVGTLVDLISGADVAVASMINPQTSFGDDVVSRIKVCREKEDGLKSLQAAVLEAVNGLIGELVRKSGRPVREICAAAFAGNTTMQQILCGITPISLGEIPFVPTFREMLSLRASEMGLAINPSAEALVFPQIGGFVGGDTVAGVIAARLDRAKGPALLVDVGTNGEIVLAYDGRLIATSVAAGPAFEGARIVNGMRATNGAIEKVVMNDDVEINVIGDARPTGFCGTGLIDTVAYMLRAGLLDVTGRILPPDELPSSVPPRIRERIVETDGQCDFIVAHGDTSGTGEHVCLYQKDIRELQLANGAIRAGIAILLKQEGLEPESVESILLAGAFGNFIRRSNARRIGMLPQVPKERISFVGNTASFGAKRALLSTTEREYACRVTRETRHLDLSLDPEFQMAFSEAMIFPDAE